MTFQWKCIDSSYIVPKTEPSDNENTVGLALEGQSASSFDGDFQVTHQQPLEIQELQQEQGSLIGELTDCDTKDGLSVTNPGENTDCEDFHNLPSTKCVPLETWESWIKVKEEPIDDDDDDVDDYDGSRFVCGKVNNTDQGGGFDIQCQENIKQEPSYDVSRYNSDEFICGKHEQVNNTCNEGHCAEEDSCMMQQDSKTSSNEENGSLNPHGWKDCNKSFPNQFDMKRDTLQHTGKRTYSCEKCNKSFASIATLKRHMFTHSGEKPYSCKECKKSFTRMGGLNRHMLTHTGEKPHSCKECDKSFFLMYNLKVHIRKKNVTNPFF